MKRFIYADNAATTQLDMDAFEAMKPYLLGEYGNASQPYSFARTAKKALKNSRETIAQCIGAEPEEIFFTSGGTESNNWAIKGTAFSGSTKHAFITSVIEHHAILRPCADIESMGYSVSYLPVDCTGTVDVGTLSEYINSDTRLVSIMTANNEIGSIQDISALAAIAHSCGAIFHTDAVQAFGQIPINVDEFNIDMLSSSGHKINGPKGIGFLYIRKGVKIRSFVHGGAQERKRRAGTENVPGIVGYGLAAERANKSMKERTAKEIEIRDHMINRILTEIPYVRLNGDKVKRLPNNVNVSIQFIEGESLLLMLDNFGICASSGSACTSGSLDPSHVLLAIGLPHEIAHGSLRMTLSEETTMEDVDFVVDKLKDITANLRSMSPLYEDFIKKQKK